MQTSGNLVLLFKPALEHALRLLFALFLMFFERFFKTLRVYGVPDFRSKFFGKFEGESERVVKTERLFAVYSLFGDVSGIFLRHKRVLSLYSLNAFIEFFKPRRERGFKLRRLFGDLRNNVVLSFDKEGIRLVVNLFDENFRNVGERGHLHAEFSRVADSPS